MNHVGGKCGCDFCVKVVNPIIQVREKIERGVPVDMTGGNIEVAATDVAEQRAKQVAREAVVTDATKVTMRPQYNPRRSLGRGAQLPVRDFVNEHREGIARDLKTKTVRETAALWGISFGCLYDALYVLGMKKPTSQALYKVPGAPGHGVYLKRKRNGRKARVVGDFGDIMKDGPHFSRKAIVVAYGGDVDTNTATTVLLSKDAGGHEPKEVRGSPTIKKFRVDEEGRLASAHVAARKRKVSLWKRIVRFFR